MKTLQTTFLMLACASILAGQTTAPGVITGSASGILSTSATLNGTVSTNGGQTNVLFNYGLTASYGSSSSRDTVDDHSKALLFNDADSNEVVIPSGIDASFSSFTIEAWAKRKANGGFDYILGQGPASPSQDQDLHFGFRDSTGGNVFTFAFYLDDLNTSAGYTDTLWHEWVGVFNSYDWSRFIYRDGVLVANDIAGFQFYGTGPIVIGKSTFDTTHYFNGEISQVRIWKAALDSTTIRSWMNRDVTPSHPNYGNLLADWRFKEGSGTVLGDSSGHGHDGTIERAAWVSSGRTASVQIPISGLTAATTYHFRISANNSAGTSNGGDSTFVTLAAATVQASNLNFSNVGEHSVTLTWTNGNGQDRIVVMREDTTGDTTGAPVNGTLYTANSAFGAGSQTASGDYVVYVGSGNTVSVTGLAGGNSYTASVYELDDLSIYPTYLTTLPAQATHATTVPNYSSIPGTALQFGGSGYLNVGSPSTLNFSGAFTIEGWFKVNSFDVDWQAIITKGDNSWRVQRYLNTNFLDFGTSGTNGNDLQGITNINDGKWHFFAAVYDGASTKNLYVDGQLDASGIGGTVTSNSSHVWIGNNSDNVSRDFIGSMDELRIWNVARTEQQVKSDMFSTISGAQKDLISYWQFNEGSGTTAHDSVSTNDALVNGSVNWVTSDAPLGGAGLYDAFASPDSLGPSGSKLDITFFSQPDSLNFIGAYTYGSPTDPPVTSETFPAGVTVRSALIWGVYAFGTDTAVIRMNYSGLPGVTVESNLIALYRPEADSPWSAPGYIAHQYASHSFGYTANLGSISPSAQFAIGSTTGNSLPVQMTSFTVTSHRLDAQLEWSTATEVNDYGFEVERERIGDLTAVISPGNTGTVDPPSGTNWIKVGFLKGAGTSTSFKRYQFTDQDLTPGTYSYRIKQINQTGSYQYSKSVDIEVGVVPRVLNLAQNYPNPFNPSTTVSFTLPEDGRVVLRVYDITGREVATLFDGTALAGRLYQVTFDAHSYASGVYFTRLVFGGKQLMKKMLLLK